MRGKFIWNIWTWIKLDTKWANPNWTSLMGLNLLKVQCLTKLSDCAPYQGVADIGLKLKSGASCKCPEGALLPKGRVLSKTHTSVSLVGIYAPPSTNTPALANFTTASKDAGNFPTSPKKKMRYSNCPNQLNFGQWGNFIQHTHKSGFEAKIWLSKHLGPQLTLHSGSGAFLCF